MNRSRLDILEDLCSLARGGVSNADVVFRKYSEGKINDDKAELFIANCFKYWSSRRVPDNIYKSLKKFDRLSDIELLKLSSSIVTHSIIEIEHNEDVKYEDLGISEFLNLIDKYIKGSEDDIKSELSGLLIKYGLKEEF